MDKMIKGWMKGVNLNYCTRDFVVRHGVSIKEAIGVTFCSDDTTLGL